VGSAAQVDRHGKSMEAGQACWSGKNLGVVLADGRVKVMRGGHTRPADCVRAELLSKLTPGQRKWLAAQGEVKAPLVMDGGHLVDAVAGMVVGWFGSIGVVALDGRVWFESGESQEIDRGCDFQVMKDLSADEEATVASIRARLGEDDAEQARRQCNKPDAMPGVCTLCGAMLADFTVPCARCSQGKVVVIQDEPRIVLPAGFLAAKTSDTLSRQVGGNHYKELGKYQPWEIIEALGLDYWEGNVLKYLLRWRKKAGLADLRKAQHYLEHMIAMEEAK